MAYMSPDYTVYLRSAETKMMKITAGDITEVNLGTDDVLLKADKWSDFPSLSELQPTIDNLRPTVGKAIATLVPGTPLTTHYTTRFSDASDLSRAQAQEMAIERLTFKSAGAQYPRLWPLTQINGPKDSGKSTLPETDRVMFSGDFTAKLENLNCTLRELQTQVINADFLDYDNSDETYQPKKTPEIGDFICQLATGAEVSIRTLYVDNQSKTYSVQRSK
jgi:hypothetical protein